MQTIYILDYSIDIVDVLCEWFKLNGFNTKGFSSLEQLLLHLKFRQPDCIIMDCLLGKPSLTINICQTIQNVFHYKGKIILISTESLSAKDIKACNAEGFIAKPFNLLHFLDVLNKVSDNSAVVK